MRTFRHILVNTAVANITTSYLWWALTFWAYLETRNVLVTGIIGGAYMLLISFSSIFFGTVVDHRRKLAVMRLSTTLTFTAFVGAGAIFLILPERTLLDLGAPWFWGFAVVILAGAVVEHMRNIALSTTVTILVPDEQRAKANGLVGMVQGVAFMITSVISGLSIGLLGMGPTLVIAISLTAASLVHLLTISFPEDRVAATPAASAREAIDLRGSIRVIRAARGLFALIIFATFNNLIGGVYMALMDPYGLELFSVEAWGFVLAIASTGFLIGGAVVAKFGLGANPMRTMLLVVAAMGVLGATFTIREWWFIYALGTWLYMCLIPAVEAAEHTVIQRVVPFERQGRVFGFAMAFETAAAPVTAFLIAPLAQLWIIPFARSDPGRETLRPLLGDGDARGIALIFLVSGLVMVVAALVAFRSSAYREMSRTYRTAAPSEADDGDAAGTEATDDADRVSVVASPASPEP
jgi:DHA3 family multidrug efflux protein-like MFS transporter